MLTPTDAQWAELKAVNTAVNAYPYKTDMELYGKPDFWDRISDKGAGDCEDYALEKRARLAATGWPIHELRLAVCLYKGEGHAVLTIDTADNGTIVLDSNFPELQSWNDLSMFGYQWLERQPETGFLWVKIT